MRAVVVGAGLGGLSAAIHLAASGARVTVLEAAAEVGGKASRVRESGFAWDTGPTLLTMPHVLDETLALAGTSLRRELQFAELEPLCRYRFASGKSFDQLADAKRTEQALSRVDEHDARAWPAFMARARELYEAAGAPYLGVPFASALGFTARMATGAGALTAARASVQSLAELARAHFRSRELQQWAGRFATYAGGAPNQTPALFAMVAHVEARGDALYPLGGMHAVAGALARAARRLGVEIRTGEPVRAVQHRSTGFLIRTPGELFPADSVVLNVDPHLAAGMFEPGSVEARQLSRGRGRVRSLSGAVLLLGLKGRTPGLALHNVFFPDDVEDEFAAIFDRGELPREPTVYVCAPSPCDDSAAPPDHEALFALVNAPARPELDVDALHRQVRQAVLARLSKLDPEIASRIVVERVRGPRDLAATGSLDGAIYGAAPHGLGAVLARPSQRVTRGLYLAGGATHPGGGVPMVVLSGKHVAALALRELGGARELRA
ncbi:MAG: phytoene desaturase [Deltaproteobacteria bacterium]|nr:phytoene desaturase [Deltaproteobacteria bacterium]